MTQSGAISGDAVAIELKLVAAYGFLIGGDDLWRQLGYSSRNAFKQARYKKLVPIPVFQIEHRVGYFAHTTDVATWLASLAVPSEEVKIVSTRPRRP